MTQSITTAGGDEKESILNLAHGKITVLIEGKIGGSETDLVEKWLEVIAESVKLEAMLADGSGSGSW